MKKRYRGASLSHCLKPVVREMDPSDNLGHFNTWVEQSWSWTWLITEAELRRIFLPGFLETSAFCSSPSLFLPPLFGSKTFPLSFQHSSFFLKLPELVFVACHRRTKWWTSTLLSGKVSGDSRAAWPTIPYVVLLTTSPCSGLMPLLPASTPRLSR